MNQATDTTAGSRDVVFLLLILVIAFLPRWYLLHLTGYGIESDEAIVGLMAKHITEGRPWPVFYYGQPYMGSLEAILAALSFNLFGCSNFALKLVPFLFSLIHVWLVYLLALKVTDRFGARIAALLTALGPSALIIWSSKARGGFIELVVLGTLALLLSIGILQRGIAASRRWEIFLLGFVLGVAWWVNNQAIFYVAAIGLVCAWCALWEGGIVRAFRQAIEGGLGFFLGGLPFWHYNFFELPRFQSFKMLGTRASWHDTVSHLGGYFSEALPIIFGARRLWEVEQDLFPGASIVAYGLFGVVFLLCVTSLLFRFPAVESTGIAHQRSGSRGRRIAILQLIVFCSLVPLIFAKSERGWLSQEPRYLLPLYSALYVLVGVMTASLRRSFKAAYAIPVAILGLNLASNYLGEVAVPGQPFVFQGERVSRDQSELYRVLLEKNLRHVRTNYWIGYRMAFETDEKITFSLFRGDRVVRIPEYEGQDANEPELSAYVLVPGEAAVVGKQLTAQGFEFNETQVGKYVVISDIAPNSSLGQAIPLRVDQIKVSSRSDWAQQLIDQKPGSRWGSGTPQAPGMTIEIDFDTPTAVAGLLLDGGFWPQDAAQSLSIEAFGNGEDTSCLLASGLTEPVVTAATFASGREGEPSSGLSAIFYFVPREVRRLRLVLEGSHPIFDWSVAELKVFAPEAAPEALNLNQ